MVSSNVFNGSCVYCNGIVLRIVSTTLVIVRSNGFRTMELTTGDSVRYRGVTVMVSDNCLVFKGGKPVHVLSPDGKGSHVRVTIKNRELVYANPLSWLTGGKGLSYIAKGVEFVELWDGDHKWLDVKGVK